MFNNLKKISLGLALAATLAVPAFAGCDCFDNNLVVNDVRGANVKDARGNCVYTKWTNGTNKCNEFAGFTLNERTIYFGFDSARLTPEGVYKLNRLLGKIKDSGKVLNATIVGHADQLGDAGYNQALSARRAEAVKNYLAQNGFNGTSVTTVTAEGENAPVTDGCGGSISCLQPDRRVEIQLSVGN